MASTCGKSPGDIQLQSVRHILLTMRVGHAEPLERLASIAQRCCTNLCWPDGLWFRRWSTQVALVHL